MDKESEDLTTKPQNKTAELKKRVTAEGGTSYHSTPSGSSQDMILTHPSLSAAAQGTRTAGSAMPAPRAADPNHFPTALYNMLREIDTNKGAAASTQSREEPSNLVSWQPHGKCFLIHNEKHFSNNVLPKYFCRLKYTSFQRQLHFHGFKRLCKQGPDKGAYHHKLFARGYPEMATYIQRVKSTKGHRGRKKKSQDREPNFYEQTTATMHDAFAQVMARADYSTTMPEKNILKEELASTNEGIAFSTGPARLERLEPTPIRETLVSEDQLFRGGDGGSRFRGIQESKGSFENPMLAVDNMMQSQGQGFLRGGPILLNLSETAELLPAMTVPPTQQQATRLTSREEDLWGSLSSFTQGDLLLPSGGSQRTQEMVQVGQPSLSQFAQKDTGMPSSGSVRTQATLQVQYEQLQHEPCDLKDQLQSHILQQMTQQSGYQQQQQHQEFTLQLQQQQEVQQLQLQQQTRMNPYLQQEFQQQVYLQTQEFPVIQQPPPSCHRDFSQMFLQRQQQLNGASIQANPSSQEGKQGEPSHSRLNNQDQRFDRMN